MASFTLKIYRRWAKGETRGSLDKRPILIEAATADLARDQALDELAMINWDTHFAALEGEDGKFLGIWITKSA